jgi:hypothetical protein
MRMNEGQSPDDKGMFKGAKGGFAFRNLPRPERAIWRIRPSLQRSAMNPVKYKK